MMAMYPIWFMTLVPMDTCVHVWIMLGQLWPQHDQLLINCITMFMPSQLPHRLMYHGYNCDNPYIYIFMYVPIVTHLGPWSTYIDSLGHWGPCMCECMLAYTQIIALTPYGSILQSCSTCGQSICIAMDIN